MNSRCCVAILLLSTAAWPPELFAQKQETPHDISDLLAPIIEKHHVPGMVAAILEGDRVTAIGAAGVRKVGTKTKVTIDDQFHIGSCTKAMTATVLAMLVEEGKLTWTTTLSEVFPDRAKEMHPDWRKVTVEQLLTHRSGAPAELNAGGLWQKLWSFKGPPSAARKLLLKEVTGRPPQAPPGSKYIYSNAGFTIAGTIAEKVTGKPWELLIRERLFKPLEMKSAGFGAPGIAGKIDQPLGHSSPDKSVPVGPGSDNPPAIGPAGTVHCTISDWAKFVLLHLDGDRGHAQLLTADSYNKLHTPAKGPGERYAMGWVIADRPWAGGRVLMHNGSNTMWFAVVWMAPEKDFAVLVMCNLGSGAKACDDAAAALIKYHQKS